MRIILPLATMLLLFGWAMQMEAHTKGSDDPAPLMLAEAGAASASDGVHNSDTDLNGTASGSAGTGSDDGFKLNAKPHPAKRKHPRAAASPSATPVRATPQATRLPTRVATATPTTDAAGY